MRNSLLRQQTQESEPQPSSPGVHRAVTGIELIGLGQTVPTEGGGSWETGSFVHETREVDKIICTSQEMRIKEQLVGLGAKAIFSRPGTTRATVGGCAQLAGSYVDTVWSGNCPCGQSELGNHESSPRMREETLTKFSAAT